MPSTFVIDPQETLDYEFDWTTDGWLTTNETISAFTVISADSNITVQSSTQTGGVVTFWVTAGVLGTRPAVTCHVTTNQGRQGDRTISFNVVNR